MKLGGFLTGLLVLAGLEVATSSAGAANRVGAIPTFAAAFVQRVISPDLGLIPNFSDQSGAAPLAHGDALAQVSKAPTNTHGGGTVVTGAGAKVRSAPTSGAGGPVGPGF